MSDELDALRKTIEKAIEANERVQLVLDQVPPGSLDEDQDEKVQSSPKGEPTQSE